jgi:hypothetical protein
MGDARTLSQRIVAAANAVKTWFDSPPGVRLQKWISLGLSAIILLLLARAIAEVGWAEIIAVLPANPLFWLFFIGSYALQPVVDWIIYHHWWKFDWRAIWVMLKKRVMNEALFSYSGETLLLVWGANRLGVKYDPDAPPKRLLGRGDGPGEDPRTNPFAAVKDVQITSGLAGNLTTLFMLVVAILLAGDVDLGDTVDTSTLRTIILFFGALIILSLSILLFRGKVMSIPTSENLRCFWWHLFRVFTAHVLFVASWIVALPLIGIETWLLLGALRMVIGRLPLPNKEILFASIAVALTGDASVQVAALMAAQGALYLVLHGVAWVTASAIEAGGDTPAKAG